MLLFLCFRQTKTQIVGGTKPTEGWLSGPEVREGGREGRCVLEQGLCCDTLEVFVTAVLMDCNPGVS